MQSTISPSSPLTSTCPTFLLDGGGVVLVDLGRQIVSGSQMLEAEERVPVSGASTTRIMLHNLEDREKARFGVGEGQGEQVANFIVIRIVWK